MVLHGDMMKYDNLDYSEMMAVLNRLMPPLKDQDYSFDVTTAKDLVCITVNRFNRFPVMEE